MTNNWEQTLRVLEEATAAGDAPSVGFDQETASLREAWLAFGQSLEAVQPGAWPHFRFSENGSVPFNSTQCSMGGSNGVRSPGFSRFFRLKAVRRTHQSMRDTAIVATGLLAVSLLVGVVTVWMLRGADRQETSAPTPIQTAAANRPAIRSPHARAKAASTDAGTQWDDSLDEQFAQIDWQMLCLRENQTCRTDAFGLVQYRMEQFRESIQTDSL